jgi:hypothetical protein
VFVLTTELMNDHDVPRNASVVIEWDYVPAATAQFAPLTPIWIDIDGSCGSFVNFSNVPVPADTPVFNFTMATPYTANLTGDVHSIFNHLHDGAVGLEVSLNGNRMCYGSAGYGESPGYISPMKAMPAPGEAGTGHSHSGHSVVPALAARMEMDMRHISSISNCSVGLGKTVPGDQWSVKAHYNLTEHPGMMEADGKPAPIMGIAVIFVSSSGKSWQ